jgi:hypothetical protein
MQRIGASKVVGEEPAVEKEKKASWYIERFSLIFFYE